MSFDMFSCTAQAVGCTDWARSWLLLLQQLAEVLCFRSLQITHDHCLCLRQRWGAKFLVATDAVDHRRWRHVTFSLTPERFSDEFRWLPKRGIVLAQHGNQTDHPLRLVER